MTDTGIISFSLESLGKMYPIVEEGDLIYKGCFFSYRKSGWGKQMELFKYPCRISAFIAILCIRGNAKVISNMRTYIVRENCFFLSMPENIIQIEKWENFEFFLVALDEEFATHMKIDFRKIFTVYLSMQKYPCIELSQNEAANISETFRNLTDDIKLFKDDWYADEIVMNSFLLTAYKTLSIISKYQEFSAVGTDPVTNRQEEYFNRFMDLLNRNYKSERNLEFYASRIFITPKYLTSLIKKISGKSASQWINELVTMEAKHLLKFSKMNIQEISDYLNFPNQSFFTQYFKRQTGITPSSYRTGQ